MAPLSKKEISHAETCKEFLVEAHKALEEATSAVEKARYATELIHPSPAPVPDAGEREVCDHKPIYCRCQVGDRIRALTTGLRLIPRSEVDRIHPLKEVPVETGEQEVAVCLWERPSGKCGKAQSDAYCSPCMGYENCNGFDPDYPAPTEPDRVEDDPDSDGLNVEPFEIGGISYQCRYSTWEKLMFGYSGWAKTPPEESVLLTHITQLRERIAELEANNE